MSLDPPRERPEQSEPSTTRHVRQTVLYSGRVQGVGFRMTAARTAEKFAVEGYVQNLPDGRVRLVAEGDEEEVDLFLASLATRMRSYIQSQSRTNTAATGEYARFYIKRIGV